ncbi:MAG: hypothetical protein V7K25_24575 [Nostoc sp.]|uniref:hypothetical protein n=1 Tax=Nostoc sp. TaxID=1180 RepID=UPI002FF47BD0
MTTNLYSFSAAQLFGKRVYQDANVLIIQKSDLLRLNPQADNTAESLLTAILITALLNFKGIVTDENDQAITDENNQAIEFDNSDSFDLLKMISWQPFTTNRNNQKYITNQIITFLYAPS